MDDAAVQLHPGLGVTESESLRERGVAALAQTSTGAPATEILDGSVLAALAHLEDGPRHRDELASRWAQDPAVTADPAAVWDFVTDRDLVVSAGPAAPVSGYHLATRDHPFLDMSEPGARRADNERMTAYAEAGDYPSVYLDLDYEAEVPVEDAIDLELPLVDADPRQALALMISGTFGRRRHVAAYHDRVWDYLQVELIFKSIPSGGSRHPTEAFFLVERSELLSPGLYHFNVRRSVLGRLPSSAAPGPSPLAVDPAAREVVHVLLASAVRRAMFRYRDPRSFRALLVDVGHADAQLAALASYCNYQYESTVTIDPDALSDLVPAEAATFPLLLSGLLQRW